MKTQSTLQRTLQALLITGISIFALALAHAAEPVQVTANNYVCAESDIQIRGYIESYNNFGKFEHFPKPYDVDNQITVRGNRDPQCSFGVFNLSSLLSITSPDPSSRTSCLSYRACITSSYCISRGRRS